MLAVYNQGVVAVTDVKNNNKKFLFPIRMTDTLGVIANNINASDSFSPITIYSIGPEGFCAHAWDGRSKWNDMFNAVAFGYINPNATMRP